MTPWSRRRRVALAAALAVAALAVDQGTKWLIVNVVMDPPRVIQLLPVLNLRLGFNTGVSFGMFADSFAGAPQVLTLLTLAVTGVIAWWLVQTRSTLEAVALGAILGGALGNIVDRARLGGVVDFIDAHYAGWHWPTFNTADIFICTGALLLVAASLTKRTGVSTAAGEAT